MAYLARVALTAILSLFAAHALAYWLIRVLPDASVTALGWFAGQEDAVRAFNSQRGLQPYTSVLSDLLRGDLGTTLDGVPVLQALSFAVAQTGPRIVFSVVLMFGFATAYAFLVRKFESRTARLSSALAFLPAFVIPIFFYAFYISLNITGSEAVSMYVLEALCVLSIAITPGALLTFQTHNSMKRLVASPHARRHAAMGARDIRVRFRLIRNLANELTPTLEKLVTMMLTLSIFAELLLNVHGLGTLTVRAVSRADWALILGLVLLFSGLVNLVRIAATGLRIALGGKFE